MPRDIDPETINADRLPGIWSPIQWELDEAEQVSELEEQATASLLHSVDLPETFLRLLLNEYAIEQAYDPPKGFDPDQQGDWDNDLITFKFKRSILLNHIERQSNYLYTEYAVEDLGNWAIEIENDKVSIYRI